MSSSRFITAGATLMLAGLIDTADRDVKAANKRNPRAHPDSAQECAQCRYFIRRDLTDWLSQQRDVYEAATFVPVRAALP